MEKGFEIFIFLILILSFSFVCVSATSVDDEFKKIANYAGEYETGNIDYVQLLLYTSSTREEMNEILGTSNREFGGILKQEQIKKILGEPTEETRWAWSEGEEKEIKLETPALVWKKIIFDGKKIQIRLNAWPSIFSKKDFNDEENKISDELKSLEGQLIYRLNFEIEFKKPEEQLDIQGRIDEIQKLAQAFGLDSSSENAEILAKESVNAERIFESYFRQSGEKCENVMGEIFGTENKRQTQKLLVNEIVFCEGENFEVTARLEMCDDCEWDWIGLDFRIETRGMGSKQEEISNFVSPDFYKNFNPSDFERELQGIVNEIKQSCENKNFNFIRNANNKLGALNNAWGQKSNNVWEEIDKTFRSKVDSMTQEQRQEFDQNYGWIKQEQEKRQKVKEISRNNYEARKRFYLNLFSGYEKKENYYSQVEFQKRLIEEFKEKGKEICDNNQDDNENKAIDCEDEQCGGKICGRGKNFIQEENGTSEVEVDFYCIEKQCKPREELKEVVRNASLVCQEIPAIECSEGSKVFFSKYDNETNCPIETSCLDETDICNLNEDCHQPACGIAECIENKCQIIKLAECKETECVDGDEKICEASGNIVDICDNGFWKKINECEQEPEIREEIFFGNQCLSASDCGSDNVCNNGMCQLLPKIIFVEPEEIFEESENLKIEENNFEGTETSEGLSPVETETQEQETNSQEEKLEPSSETETTPQESETSQEPDVTGNIVFNFVGNLFLKIKILGSVITGFDTKAVSESSEGNSGGDNNFESKDNLENNENSDYETEWSNEESENTGENIKEPKKFEGDNFENFDDEFRDENQENEERREEDRERKKEDEKRNEENKKRCEKECARPCVEKCIRKECGEELNCIVDEAQKKCEGECKSDDGCAEKCMKGGDWWKEFENKDEHKEEKGVFQVGGNCRTSQGKTEGFIWFNGWGEPFEKIQNLKNKYYSGGQADWCKYDFENLKKQRQEFEKGFNQEFVQWFFEKYLANSAENWEQSVSGIFELYWKDVDNSREMVYRMQCLGIDELPDINLINVKYNTAYGSIEFWEEIKNVKLGGMDKATQVVSPYMKAWVFPTKEFIIYEMKKSMKEHEFPGSSEEKTERKNQEGPTEEERAMIKQDEKFMNYLKEISEKYGGSLDLAIQFKDYETDEVVFNLYAQVNENEIMKIEPMLPEEIPSQDAKVEIDFKNIYEMIYETEKEMNGERIESPPWDRKLRPVQKIKEVTNGIKMYFKIRKIINSAKITPAESEEDVKNLFEKFMPMIMEGDKPNPEKEKENEKNSGDKENDLEKEVWESKEVITGEIVLIK